MHKAWTKAVRSGRGGGSGRGKGSGRVRGTRTLAISRIIGTGTFFCSYVCINLFLLFYFSNFQVSSASSPPLPGQTRKGIPLNTFSWVSLAPNVVGITAVNNIAGKLVGRSRGPDHLSTLWMRWLYYLEGGGCPRSLTSQRCGLLSVPYLVIRCGSVPKVGTVPLQRLHFKLNIKV